MLIIEPDVFDDARGFFLESYNETNFSQAVGFKVGFVQDNHTRSTHGVLRGLHYQLPPHAQGKLVRVTLGAVFDVAVDLRKSSPSYRRWAGVALSAENRRIVWLPPGLAHGYLVTGEVADFLYKTTQYYAPEFERCIRWNDPDIGVDWPLLNKAPLLAARDAFAPLLSDSASFD